jgi:putative membrane protein insertion efficiency factor
MKPIFIFLIRFQQGLAPFWRALLGSGGACCRFHPTCSEYAVEAIEKHGVVRGIGLALGRLGRCHPWGKGGWDVVEEVL